MVKLSKEAREAIRADAQENAVGAGVGDTLRLLDDYATLEAENAKLKGEYEWVASINTALDESNQIAWAENAKLRAELERLPVDGWKLVPIEPTPGMAKVSTWDMNSFYPAPKVWADMLAAQRAIAELREVNRIQLEIATVHGAACVGIRKQRDKLMAENEMFRDKSKGDDIDYDLVCEERDKLRAVLEGAEYPNTNNLYNLSIEDCRRVGEATAGLTKSIISSYKMKIEDIAKCRNAELGEIVWKFIDRMNDVCEQDTAENIISDFLKQVNPITHSVIDAIWKSKKSSKKDA